jgi:hypothetical protein
VFPEGVYYNRKNGSFRTEKVNFIFELIERSSTTPAEKKKGQVILSITCPFLRAVLKINDFMNKHNLACDYLGDLSTKLKIAK